MSMKQYHDGGEAILEAFRSLGMDYIISSPGSEWSPVWEAVARQKVNQKAGPTYIDCWHETLAVDMALGYTQMARASCRAPRACIRRCWPNARW
jgi:acetolactate synthase-1/2/3 large subunit